MESIEFDVGNAFGGTYAVDFENDVRAGQGQQIVVSLDLVREVLESLSYFW